MQIEGMMDILKKDFVTVERKRSNLAGGKD